MFRRVFLLQVLLGWLIVVAEKLNIFSLKTAVSAVIASLTPDLEPITLFVAPNGNDSWSGRQEIANPDHNDGPLATLAGAKIAIRKLKSQQPQQRAIAVMLRGGTYFLSEPVVFQPEDSGSVKQPITYQSYPGETAIISGGKVISGWQPETVNNLPMWTVKLPQDSSTAWQFQHLWINGERRSRSRYPSQGYLQVQALDNKPGQNWFEGNSSLQYRQGDLPQINPDTFKDVELVVMNRWTESRLPITKVDPTQRQIYFSKESVFQLAVGDLYYLDNALEFLTTPGQWYLDRQQAKLYYLPLPEEDINTAEIIVPVIDSLLVFRGSNLQQNYIDSYIQHLNFKNLTFSHTDWQLPQNISGYIQNALGVPGAVHAFAIKNCTWSGCTFAHLGNYALELGDECQHNQIAYCSFFDLGGGGIKIGRQEVNDSDFFRGTNHNFIVNNHLFDGGKFFHSAAAIAVVKSHDNLIAHNHIHDYYYTGITVMGNWGFEATPAYQNLIEHNHIHHIGKLSNGEGPIISDMGGIYILGSQKGTKIRHNKIHDIEGLRYGGWGIYLDEGSSYILVEHNLVYKTSHGGFVQHYGRENLIRYNIFAFGKTSQIHRVEKDLEFAREGNFISFRFENNIVYWQEGEFITGFDPVNTNEKYQSHAVFNHNIYWKQQQSDFSLGNLTWQQWQQRDRHSLITDPLFIAPQKDNFQLQPDSPALKLGFND
ncbi:MAG: right-handed parallel beta-helix repeat-containing protein [Waterburya sp.]